MHGYIAHCLTPSQCLVKLWCTFNQHTYSTSEETESEKLNALPMVTQQTSSVRRLLFALHTPGSTLPFPVSNRNPKFVRLMI